MKKGLVSILFFVVTSSLICAQTIQSQTRGVKNIAEAEMSTALQNYIDQLAAEDLFSGAVLVARGDTPILLKAYGLADKKLNISNKVDTKFNIASMTKMFTAVAVAQLVEAGRLSFNDSIGRHLPDYPNKEVADRVTIHHLLTHSSGLGDYQNEKFYARLDKMRKIADLVPLFVTDPLKFQPGDGWDYSNAGFAVLGMIIEKVSGQSYFDYVKEHIFKPAGMMNTDFYERDKNIFNRALGYMKANAKGEPDPEGFRQENTSTRPAKGSSAGGAYSTVNDLFKFRAALFGHKLLSEKYKDILTRAKVKVPPGWPMNEYGYGFQINVIDGQRIVGHGGAAPGVSGKFDTYPELGYTVVILSNYDLPAIMPVVKRTRELILQQ